MSIHVVQPERGEMVSLLINSIMLHYVISNIPSHCMMMCCVLLSAAACRGKCRLRLGTQQCSAVAGLSCAQRSQHSLIRELYGKALKIYRNCIFKRGIGLSKCKHQDFGIPVASGAFLNFGAPGVLVLRILVGS